MEKMTEKTNPLNKYFRQASVYIKLPSGLEYPESVVEKSESGELAVQPMTAMDEIKFKTPDALMNGQGVVDVIQSCIPQIKDAWKIVSYDIDAIFLAIRIATYGETMDITYNMPGTQDQKQHTINLPAFLDEISRQKIEHSFKIKELTFHVSPLTYRDMNLVSLETFQQQKIYASLRTSNITDEDKVKTFDESFKKMNDLTQEILLKNISRIDTGTETVSDPQYISEFLKNGDAKLISEIQKNLARLRMQGSAPSVKLKSSEDDIKKGAPASYEVPVTFDTANFFV
tara:strand:+ start:1050 stop:1907 length:858 start_codon:yes stop_codon:yes gene_type:complete